MKTACIIIIIFLSLDILLFLFTRWFGRRVYIPFLLKMKMGPVKEPVYNPHLLRLGLWVIGGSAIVYLTVGLIAA